MRNNSIYEMMIQDSYAKYFTKENYGVVSDGKTDVSDKLQEAINSIALETGYGILYIPEGKYLITKTIYIPKAVRVIGYGAERPEFILADYADNFDKPKMNDNGGYRYLFWFVDKVVTDEEAVEDSNPGTFYSAMSNVNIRLGEGNPYAVALRTHYAQHAFLSHMDIRVESGMAAIYDVGNEMENIAVYGGNYAIVTTKCSPGWPFLMVDTYFENQKVSAIKCHESGLTIIRNKTVNVPKFIDVDEEFFERIYMENCVLENVTDCIFDVAMDENSLTQINVKNVGCTNVKTIARYKDSGRQTDLDKDGVINYLHGTVISDKDSGRRIMDKVEITDTEICEEQILKSDIKELPPVSAWTDVSKLGIIGDGKTNNSPLMDGIIEKYKVLYFPQGEYIFTDAIKLKKDSILIGMHPYATRLILKDNSECFTGIGSMKGFIETPEEGVNIINGVGIETGGKNPRAVALLWKSGAESYANDVKLIGGHGNLVKGTGAFDIPYNESRTADINIERLWDAQYPSFLVQGGGGVFKDIWSASPYATAGFEVRNSTVPSKVYCMSLEHHQRVELRMINSSNWDFYAIQTEEELAEGEYALPFEIIESSDVTFNTAYFFRTIFVKTPMDYCVKCYKSKNIQFNNINNCSQMKYTITGFLKNMSSGNEIRLWQAAKVMIGNKAINESGDIHVREVILDENKIPSEQLQIENVFEGFRFADGGITDSKGNFYFIDSLDKRVYKIDEVTKELTIIFESPIKINSLAFDTEENLIFIGEYIIPKGATKDGVLQENILPPDSYGTSYGYWYNKDAVTFAFTMCDGNIVPLDKVKIGSVKPKLIYYPGNRWRDGADYREVVKYNPKEAYIAPDGKTIIPCHYDLIRANNLSKGVPGEKLYSVDEMYKRVYACDILENGLLDNPKVVAGQGDFCAIKSAGTLFVCDDNIKEYGKDGKLERIVKTPERATTIGLDKSGANIKYITSTHKVYVVKSI